jgi:hypothetical protein
MVTVLVVDVGGLVVGFCVDVVCFARWDIEKSSVVWNIYL